MMDKQSKTQSIIESIINISIGYVVSLVSQLVIFPVFDIHIKFIDNIYISLWFTAISLTRLYLVRRFFSR